MEKEEDLIQGRLAYVRDNVFDESDFVSDEGYDLLGNLVGSPYEVLRAMETKIARQQKQIFELQEDNAKAYQQGRKDKKYEFMNQEHD